MTVANNFGAKETFPCISMKISHFLYVYSDQDEKYSVIFYTSLIDCTAKKSDICEVCLWNKNQKIPSLIFCFVILIFVFESKSTVSNIFFAYFNVKC